MLSPVGVVFRQSVGDVGFWHQQESSRHVNAAADGQENERVVARDSLFVQNLQGKKGHLYIYIYRWMLTQVAIFPPPLI